MIKPTLAVVVISTLLLGCGDTGQRAAKAAAEAVLEEQNVEQAQVNQYPSSQPLQEPTPQPAQPQTVNTVQSQQSQVSPQPIKLEAAPPKPTIIEQPSYRIKTKQDGFIYMRNDRYSEAEKTHKLLDGTRVDIYECYEKENRTDVDTGNIGRWCLVELQDGSTGYIFSSYITPRID